MSQSRESDNTPRLPFRPIAGGVLIVVLLLLAWRGGRSGFASLLTAYAAKSNDIGAADLSVRLDPRNPDSHYVRGTILEGYSDLPGAVEEYRKAAMARPSDYALWLSLARAQELNAETSGAIAAARQAIPLAPYYAQPHYQLGNILLRAGQKDEAFRELGLAGISNPALMPGVIDLAWRMSGGNAQYVERAMAPNTPSTYQMLGQYFRQHEAVDAAIAMFLAAGSAAEADRRSYLAELIGAKQFKAAARLWAVGRSSGPAEGVLTDPGFEEENSLNEPGFGWRWEDKPQGFHVSLDPANPRQGRYCLKVEFNGNHNPDSPIVSQLVLVEPNAHYQLQFSIRAEDLVSGGLPRLLITDANTNNVLGQSVEFPRASGGWRDYVIDFRSGQSTGAVQVALQRQICDRTPCPIFGRLWLDNFGLQKL
jgi:hypothetical protein